jgi:uncharacterized protein (DUF2164 family)
MNNHQKKKTNKKKLLKKLEDYFSQEIDFRFNKLTR